VIPGILAPTPKLPARPYVPATAFTMWSLTYPFPTTSAAWNGHSIRQQIAPLTGAGQQFRFTFDQGAGLDHASFEIQSANYNTLYGPAEITFGGGGHGFLGSGAIGGSTIVSDWITLPHFIDNTMQMVVITDVTASGSFLMGFRTVASCASWYSPIGVASYNVASPTGTWTSAGYVFGLSKIEAR